MTKDKKGWVNSFRDEVFDPDTRVRRQVSLRRFDKPTTFEGQAEGCNFYRVSADPREYQIAKTPGLWSRFRGNIRKLWVS